MPHHGAHSMDGVVIPEGTVAPPADQQSPPPAVDPTAMPTVPGAPMQNVVPNTVAPQSPPQGAGAPHAKAAPLPSNVKMLPPMLPKGAVPAVQKAESSQQATWASDSPLMMPKDSAAKQQGESVKGSLRIVSGVPSRNPSAPMVENQLLKTATAPNSNEMKR